jgi:hypothetical protein
VFVSVTKAYTEMGKRKMPLFYKSPHPTVVLLRAFVRQNHL